MRMWKDLFFNFQRRTFPTGYRFSWVYCEGGSRQGWLCRCARWRREIRLTTVVWWHTDTVDPRRKRLRMHLYLATVSSWSALLLSTFILKMIRKIKTSTGLSFCGPSKTITTVGSSSCSYGKLIISWRCHAITMWYLLRCDHKATTLY